MPTPGDFDRVNLGGKSDSSYAQNTNEGVTGEFGTSIPENYPAYEMESPENVPLPGDPPLQFSSRTSGDPRDLLESTRSSVQAHADINLCYGLTQPVSTPGSHPWLRDSLATSGTDEPAGAQPNQVRGVPLQRTPPNK
jgi:hypothetical protein